MSLTLVDLIASLTHIFMGSPDRINSLVDSILSSVRAHLPSPAVMTSEEHATTEGGWGPGTFVDEAFHSVPDESRRIMRLIASQTPGIAIDESALSEVEFSGADLSLIPGPLKSQVVVRQTIISY